jgi:hypothetical protein
MKSGIELIAKERQEQLGKHNRAIEMDVSENDMKQLRWAAQALITEMEEDFPFDWGAETWKRLMAKPEIERLAIAGALIAAEIDRINYIKK